MITYKNDVSQSELAQCLIGLYNYYHLTLSENSILVNAYHDGPEENNSEIIKYMVYQCKNCLTVYDKAYGDMVNGIAANTAFETLSWYSCPVCEASKEEFLPVEKMIAAL